MKIRFLDIARQTSCHRNKIIARKSGSFSRCASPLNRGLLRYASVRPIVFTASRFCTSNFGRDVALAESGRVRRRGRGRFPNFGIQAKCNLHGYRGSLDCKMNHESRHSPRYLAVAPRQADFLHWRQLLPNDVPSHRGRRQPANLTWLLGE